MTKRLKIFPHVYITLPHIHYMRVAHHYDGIDYRECRGCSKRDWKSTLHYSRFGEPLDNTWLNGGEWVDPAPFVRAEDQIRGKPPPSPPPSPRPKPKRQDIKVDITGTVTINGKVYDINDPEARAVITKYKLDPFIEDGDHIDLDLSDSFKEMESEMGKLRENLGEIRKSLTFSNPGQNTWFSSKIEKTVTTHPKKRVVKRKEQSTNGNQDRQNQSVGTKP